jgi:DNA-binding MarR family transcriptional regulator
VVAEPTEWLSEAEQRLWRQLLSVHCRLKERLDHDLQAGSGLTLGEYDVLVHLSEAPGRALRMSELADRLLLSRSGLTRRIDSMVKAGLVTRRPCHDDGRGALAELTPAGFDLIVQAAPVHVAGIRRYLLTPISKPGQPERSGEPADLEGLAGLAGLALGLARIEGALGDAPYRTSAE